MLKGYVRFTSKYFCILNSRFDERLPRPRSRVQSVGGNVHPLQNSLRLRLRRVLQTHRNDVLRAR